jgi:hypothetical protein
LLGLERFPEGFVCAEIVGEGVLTLPLPQHFIYLCVHQASEHQFERLIWLVDLVQLLRANSHLAQSVAKALGSKPTRFTHICLFHAFRFLKEIFELDCDADMMSRLKPASPLVRWSCGLLRTTDVLRHDGWSVQFRRKLFREVLKAGDRR